MGANKKGGDGRGGPSSPKSSPSPITNASSQGGRSTPPPVRGGVVDASTSGQCALESPTLAENPKTRGEGKAAQAVSPPRKTSAELAQAPLKLLTVVAAASAAAPRPSGEAPMRPPLSSAGASAAGKATSAKPATAPLTFAQAVSGAAGKAAPKTTTPDVVGKYIPARQSPPEAQLRNRNERGLQDLFQKRWHSEQHGVCIENARGVSSERYLEAIAKVVPLNQVFAMGPIGQGNILVTLNSVEAANELMLKGIDLAGRHLSAYPEARKPQRVVLSPVPVRVDDQCLIDFLSRFGKVHGKIRGLPLRLGEKGLARGIFSLSREAFITLNQGCELPPGFRLLVEGSTTYVELATETRCYGCRQVGHQIARCPRRAQKEKTVLGPPTVTEPSAAEAVTTSDEEVPTDGPARSPKKGKLRKRKKKKEQQPTEEAALMPPPEPKAGLKPASTQGSMVSLPFPRPPVSGSDAEKRPRSDDGEVQTPAPKAIAVSTGIDTSDLSDVEVAPLPRSRHASVVGYETDSSAVSVGSGVETEGPLNRSQLRDLVKKVSSKRNMEAIRGIIASFTTRYWGLATQLRKLEAEARVQRQYNQEAKLGRIIAKVEQIANEADANPRSEESRPASSAALAP